MGMISSRQAVLSRTSRTGVQSRRSWGSKAIRMGEGLEDFLARELAIGCSPAILTPDVRIFEEGFGRGPRKSQAQTRFATATSKPFKPGDRVVWWKQTPGGGHVEPVLSTVLAVTAKRVKIEAEDEEGKVIRHVLPGSIERHVSSSKSNQGSPK